MKGLKFFSRTNSKRCWNLALHKMVATDDAECFHTHPAHAIRIVLRGGYVEELEDGSRRTW